MVMDCTEDGVRSMIRETHSIYIDAPVEKVYEYWTDPENWSEIAPAWAHVENKNIKRAPKIAGTTFDSYGTMVPGLPPMRYSIEFVDAEPNRRLVMCSEGPSGGKDTMTALFEPVDSGTVLTAIEEREETAVERVPLLGRLAGVVVGQMETLWMRGLKAKMEGRT